MKLAKVTLESLVLGFMTEEVHFCQKGILDSTSFNPSCTDFMGKISYVALLLHKDLCVDTLLWRSDRERKRRKIVKRPVGFESMTS